MPGKLFVTGTPIGNLGDFSPRAIEAMRECDFIAAEDTRVSSHLLNHFGIKKPLVSYFEHNKAERGPQICARIQNGETAVLVTDAGMPAISDPGEDLVALCRREGITVTCCPGPTAVTTALALSGLSTRRFTFEGFLSTDKKERREHLKSLQDEQRTMVFYEAPHKLENTLHDFEEFFGDRAIVLARELTKIHEEVVSTTVSKALALLAEKPPRGEYVLVLSGSTPTEKAASPIEQAVTLAKMYMQEGASVSEAAKRAASDCQLKKSEVYRLLVTEKGE